MTIKIHNAELMGPILRTEVERQLWADFAHYGSTEGELLIDWSTVCPEGHCTTVYDGWLESSSYIELQDLTGSVVASGWMDFIHGGSGNPLHIFWLYLDVRDPNGTWRSIQKKGLIPDHVWNKLSEQTKSVCAARGQYDTRWSDDPKVKEWQAKLDGPQNQENKALKK